MEPLILNEKFEKTNVLDTFESIIWTDRYSAYGDFEIYTSANKSIIDMAKPDYYISDNESEHMMIIEDLKLDSDVEFGNHYTITGRSLESILTRRIVWSQTVLDGYIEGQIEKLLNQNIINPSNTNRKIPNFIFEKSNDPTIQSLQIQAQFTGDNLYDAVKKICDTASIGFKVTFNDQNQFVFKLYSGADRSYDQITNPYVVFSPNFENIINSNYTESYRGLSTVGLVAGEGEGSARKTVVVGDNSSSGMNRRELFVDARDISSQTSDGTLTTSQYNSMLTARGNEKMVDSKVVRAFDGEVETSRLYQYGRDFYMGDIVQLENEYGMTSRVRITEYIYSESKQGRSAYPTFVVL